MDNTPNLELPYILPSQAQKHVTHNEALILLDALAQLAVLDRDLTAPPSIPGEGDRYIVAASASGAWAGQEGKIAHFLDGAWRFYAAMIGWLAWVVDEGRLVFFDGAAWQVTSAPTVLQNVALLGLGTTADNTNPFSAKLNKALWTAKTAAEGGDGDLRYTLNKETSADVLSLLMQTGFSGRAELGLIGSDDLDLKVSANGSSWQTALSVDRNTGGVRFLANSGTLASASTCNIGAAAALRVSVTGTAAISSFGTVANSLRFLTFAGSLTLTHNAASLILPGAASIVTAAGDSAIAASDASGNWRVLAYQRASGKAVAAPAPNDLAGPVDSRRNAFLNPFLDVAQAYAGSGTFAMSNGPMQVDMMQFAGSGATWTGELVAFTPGQTEVPGNPKTFLRVSQTGTATGYAIMDCIAGPVDIFAGRPVTLSFYARALSGTLNIAGYLRQEFGTGGSAGVIVPPNTTYGLTAVWQRFSVPINVASLTGRTIGACNRLLIRLTSNAGGAPFQGDFCGLQLEEGDTASPLNAVPRIEAATLCRHYYEKVPVRAINGAIWVPCLAKRAVPAVSATAGTVSNATVNGCLLTHSVGADAVVTFDARL